jgi:hypothetical protein
MPRSPKGRAAARGLDARLSLQHAFMPAVPTPSCSFLTSQPRLPPGTGHASSAAAKTRRFLPKNGARCAGFAGPPTRQRWTTRYTPNAC